MGQISKGERPRLRQTPVTTTWPAAAGALMKPGKFFVDLINRLRHGSAGAPLDPEKHDLYWGLYSLALQQQEIADRLLNIERALQRLAPRSQ